MARPAGIRVDPARAPEPSELVTLGAIGHVLGVERGTVDVWRHRGRGGVPFPDADEYLGRRPLWRWATIAAWCEVVA